MAEKQVGVRLSVIDGGKVKAELRSVGQEGSQALDKINQATRPASVGLKVVNETAVDLRAGMASFASRLGPVAAGLSALGPIGLAAAAGAAAVTAALSHGLKDYAEAEEVTKRLQAVLDATGHAAGLTADQLDEYADHMEATTSVTAEAVKGAAAVLATFRSVAGDTFLRTLGLAQDLSATFGGELSSSAVQLGKALEDPVTGISALARVGVTFSTQQKEVIKNLVETGRQADAQKLILDVLAQQVGGAGAAGADSLSGAYKRAGDAVGNFLEELVRNAGIAPTVRAALEGIAAGINLVTAAALKGVESSDRLAAANNRLLDAQKRLQEVRDLQESTGNPRLARGVAEWERRVEALKAEVEAIGADIKAQEADAQKAQAGRATAESEAATGVALAKLEEYRKALADLASPEDKIRALNETLAKTVESLNALKGRGADAGAVDEAISAAQDATRRQIEDIQKPGQEAAQSAAEQTKKLIDDLTTSINLFGQDRAQFIKRYVERVGDGASAEELARVRALAGALYDKGKAEEAARQAVEDHQQAMEDGRQVTEEMRTATEKYAARLAELDGLLKKGAISQETYARAVDKARAELEKHATDGISALRYALREYSDETADTAKQMKEVVGGAFKGIEDAIVDLVLKGKLEWKDLVDSILADIIRLTVRQTITGPLSSALGSLIGGTFHQGGRVGTSTPDMREMPAALWAGAPRAHTGARLLRPGEVPIIAELGERVLNRQETRDYESGVGRAIANRAGALKDALEMTINVAGARGNQEIMDMVNEGVQRALAVYDRTKARVTAVEAVTEQRARTSISRLR